MSLLSIALHQVTLRPQYHPSYPTEPKKEAGRPMSKLRSERKEKLHAASLEIGESQLAGIMEIIRLTDPKLHEDNARKMLDELVEDKRMDRRITTRPRKKVFYTARPQ